MSAHDAWLLEGSDPEWSEEDAPRGFCDLCETPVAWDDAGDFCPTCSPRELLATFRITDGRVTEAAQ